MKSLPLFIGAGTMIVLSLIGMSILKDLAISPPLLAGGIVLLWIAASVT